MIWTVLSAVSFAWVTDSSAEHSIDLANRRLFSVMLVRGPATRRLMITARISDLESGEVVGLDVMARVQCAS